MIQSVWVKNQNGDKLTLDLRSSGDDHGLLIFNLTGLGSSMSTLNSTSGPSYPGTRVNSVKIEPRQLILTLAVNKFGTKEEEARALIYKHFPAHGYVRFGVKTDAVDVFNVGVVKNIEMNIFAKVVNAVISIEFPFPHWTDRSWRFYSISPDGKIPAFSFPFSNDGNNPQIEFGYVSDPASTTILYDGDISTGCTIDITFNDVVTELALTNTNEAQEMVVDILKLESIIGSAVAPGDRLSIYTHVGDKRVILTRAGSRYKVLGLIPWTTHWMVIYPGYNIIKLDAGGDEDLLEVDISFGPLRSGI